MSKNNCNVVLEKNQRGLFAFILAALISTSAYDAQAAIFLWDNTGTQYTQGPSWVGDVAPAATGSSTTTDDIQFGSVSAGFNSVNLSSSRAAASFTFLAGANAYTIGTDSAKKLSISYGLTNNSTATQTFNILLENAQGNNTWTQVAGGNLVFNNGVALGTSATVRNVTLAGGGTFNFNSAITQNTSTGSKLTVNNANGVVNLNNFANSIGGATGGGIVINAGQVNFSNAQSLGTGIVELSANTGSSYGSSILNNASGSAITLTGVTGVTWSGSTTGSTGIQFGTSGSTSANSIDFGSGLVTASTDRSMNIAGSGVTISMGILNVTGKAERYIFTFDGVGNTIDFDGWRIGAATDQDKAAIHQLKGSANINMGAIVNGTPGTNGITYANSAIFNSDGVTRLTGNNTYTGTTEFVGGGTNIISGNNSAAVGNVTIAGATGSGKTPVVRLDNVNGISSSSSLLGSSSSSQTGTLELKAAGDFSLNSFGIAGTAGNNMIFTNSSGSQKTLAFTAANNYITTGSTGGRTLYNNSANLLLDFDGNIEIGGVSSGGEATSFAGVGNFNVDGNLLDTGTGLTRTLRKQDSGTLTLRGSANNRGSTLVEGGKLEVAGALSIASAITVSSGATLKFNQSSGGISVGAMTVAGTLEQELVTITSSGAVNLTGATLKVNGTPSLASYTLVTGNSLTGRPTLNPSIPNYQLVVSGNNVLLQQQIVKATPTIVAVPSASAITYGQTLADSNLTGGTASTPGSYAFTTPSTSPNVGTANQNVTFTPTDTANYNTVTTTVSVTVNSAGPIGSTFTSVGFEAGTENNIAANGLSNLMNYALGQNGPNAPLPAKPVLNTDSSGMTLSATARTDDSSLKFYVEWTTDLSGVTDSWNDHSTQILPPDLTGTITYGGLRKFLRFKVTTE